MKNSEKIPLVSICCITFNHEKFISKCIEGFLMQKTDFAFEILIHDDASTDSTQEIIMNYAKKHQGLIITVLQTENQYSKGIRIVENYIYPKSRGKYIALCEGDDFWTDPLKLQKQVDFLEHNSDYGLVCTDYNRLIEKTGELTKNHNKSICRIVPTGNIYNNLLIENKIGTATVLFRKRFISEFSELPFFSGEKKYKMGDYPRWLMISLKSKIWYIDETTTTYRVLESSASHFIDKKKKYEFLLSEFQVKYDFIKAFGCNKGVKEKIKTTDYKNKIKYGFFDKDSKMIRSNYKKLLQFSKPTLKEKIMFYSTASDISWNLTRSLVKLKNNLSI